MIGPFRLAVCGDAAEGIAIIKTAMKATLRVFMTCIGFEIARFQSRISNH
jgi:hypothetical protein